MKKPFLFIAYALGLMILPARANLFIDGDFSTLPGSGSTAPTQYSGNADTYQYLAEPTGGGPTGSVTNVGGTGGWTFYNASGAGFSAVNLEPTLTTTAMPWIPVANTTANPNGYVVQLDTIAHSADAHTPPTFKTGNAISQVVSVTVGQLYSLTFSINTENGTGKAGTSYADVMITNATIGSTTGSSGTITTGNANNKNALTYGNVTGYQYSVTTTGAGGTASNWATYTLTFTATSTTAQVTFADDTLDCESNSNIALEGLNLVVVPEPRQWALMVLMGVGILVFFRKLRLCFPR
jgi:hypothetical protein